MSEVRNLIMTNIAKLRLLASRHGYRNKRRYSSWNRRYEDVAGRELVFLFRWPISLGCFVSRISQMQVRAVRTLWEGLLRQSKLCRLFRWTLLMAICRELAVRALDAMSPSKMLLQSTVERERGRTVGEEGVLVSCSERIQHGSCWMKMCRGPTGWRLDVN
jgi:hypothetical protein